MTVHKLANNEAFLPQHWPQLLTEALQQKADTRHWQAAGNASPESVLEAYRNNTSEGRIRALQVTFPVVEQLLGDAAFSAYASDYVLHHPAFAADLDEFGHDFAEYLKGCQRLNDVPYVAEMAAFEWCVQAARFACLQTALSSEQLTQIDEPQLERLRVSTPVSLQSVTCEHNVHELWLWHRAPAEEFQLKTGAFNLIINMQLSPQQGWHITATSVSAEEAGLLSRANQILLTDMVTEFAERGMDVSESLQRWLVRQWLVAHD